MQRLPVHWREYTLDGVCLALFMMSAAGFATLLQHPASPLAAGLVTRPVLRALLMGMAMGGTAVALIYSPMGQRSGAHMNPAVTLTYLVLGRVSRGDAAGYVAGQLAGGASGLLAALVLFGGLPGDPAVNYVATLPGPAGVGVAFAAEGVISFVLMASVLRMSADQRRAPYTGLVAGTLVAAFIAIEAPLSGMSMNLARTLPSNLLAGMPATLWIYATAPLLGMWTAAAQFAAARGRRAAGCAKLHHSPRTRCIFCGFNPTAS